MRTILLILVAALSAQGEPVTPTKKIRLFNGKDLTNFYVVLKDSKLQDPKKVFTASQGLIHITGEELSLIHI